MTTKRAGNPEKWMYLLFPLITLAFFVLGAVLFTGLPQWLNLPH